MNLTAVFAQSPRARRTRLDAQEPGRRIAVELGLILWIDYTAAGQMLFGTTPPTAHVWLFVVPFALSMLLLAEGRKAIARGILRRHPERFRSTFR